MPPRRRCWFGAPVGHASHPWTVLGCSNDFSETKAIVILDRLLIWLRWLVRLAVRWAIWAGACPRLRCGLQRVVVIKLLKMGMRCWCMFPTVFCRWKQVNILNWKWSNLVNDGCLWWQSDDVSDHLGVKISRVGDGRKWKAWSKAWSIDGLVHLMSHVLKVLNSRGGGHCWTIIFVHGLTSKS